MNLTRPALGNPTAVVVAILLVLLFGTISLLRLPVQMIPDIERPTVQINTFWRAAAPDEVESEILEPQEDALRGLPGLEKLESSASRGFASINLQFVVGSSLERSMLEVMNRLNRVPRYPPDTDEPVIFAGRGQFGSSIAWFAVRPLPGNEADIAGYQEFVEEVIQPRIERVSGIANSDVYGGRGREIRITFDPYKAAAHNIQFRDIAALAGNNTDTSGGFTDVGRRQYTLRYNGSYALDEFEDMVLSWRDGAPIRLRDVARVESALVDPSGMLSQNGGPSMAFNAQAEAGVNILKVMEELKTTVAALNEGPLKRAGLFITQVYDETIYVNDSIAMLRTNLLLGIALAVGVLWWFLRRLRATLIVAIAIPISLFMAFLLLELGGRSINIISLAGLAFAMGMVLDAAIVVLENIVRLREDGMARREASETGAGQVMGALIASTATTVAIFLPILFLRDAAGQLFADLAFAIAVAVITSLLIAITVIPTAANSLLRNVQLGDPHAGWWERMTNFIMRLTDTPARRAAWIAALVLLAAGLTVLLRPQPDYLPEGKQNYADAVLLPPPGLSYDTAKRELVDVIDARMMKYLNGEAEPKISSYYLGVFGSFGFMGVRAEDRADVDAVLGILNGEVLRGFPDTIAFASRSSIFGRVGAGRNIDMNIQSRDIDALLEAARFGMSVVASELNDARTQPVPGVELAEPELRLYPDERRIAEAGWNRRDMSAIVRALGDGLFVGDYFDGDKRLDIVLRAEPWTSPEDLAAMPLATPLAGVVPVSQLMRLDRTAGPAQIRRVDRRRTITLRITPPSDLSLQETIDILKTEVEPRILDRLPDDGEIIYYGSADNLKVALANMGRSFGLAVIILYLLMSALFHSFRDSLMVILALPLATVGGVAALRITDLLVFQPMDLLTMIGFVTLLGLVVNNAILLVHQTRSAERDGVPRRDAVRTAVRVRLRPILMSTLTSLFGMLPLLLIPGPGTELYRGLAAVIVGGMSVSTLFTLILLPSLLRIGEQAVTRQPEGSPGRLGDQYV